MRRAGIPAPVSTSVQGSPLIRAVCATRCAAATVATRLPTMADDSPDELSKHGDQDDQPSKVIPRGVDPPPADERERAARDLLDTLADVQAIQPRDRAAAARDKVRRFQQVTGLAADGVYGTRTRAELARVLGLPVSRVPATLTSSSSSQAPADTETVPTWLPVAAALARWTEDARAADSVASQKLRALAPHAARIAPMTTAMRGIVVGEVPEAPTEANAAAWAASAWARARSEGASARAALSSHARSITQQAERALSDVRRALDRETDSAVRGALEMVERGLVAILRPVSTAVREGIARPLGLPIVIAGLAALAFMGGGSRRRS